MKHCKIHELKIDPQYYEDIIDSIKTFEIRKNDRDYNVGDSLHLKEFDRNINKYSGRVLDVKVRYVLKNVPGLQDGYVILGISIFNVDLFLDIPGH